MFLCQKWSKKLPALWRRINIRFNHYQKFDKTPFVIYADLKCLIQNIDGGQNNSANSSKTKVVEYIPSTFSITAISPFKNISNKYDVYRGKGCMK